jgi:hypothetical protein
MTVNVVASWVVAQFEITNSILANQKVVNSEQFSGEPVSYKIKKSMDCKYL